MLNTWEAIDQPTDHVYNTVLHWLAARLDDPYANMTRDDHMPNLWWGAVPGTRRGDGGIVVCVYEIRELDRLIVCHSLAYLSEPVTSGEPLIDPEGDEGDEGDE